MTVVPVGVSVRKVLLITGVLVAIAAGVLVVWAPGGQPRDALDLPTSGEPEGIGMEAGYEGRVSGDVHTGCLFTETGTALLVWPEGFYALDDPPRVVRPNGEVALNLGDDVRMAGGFSPVAEQCGTSASWIVSAVESPAP
jgi:hypothetical protein